VTKKTEIPDWETLLAHAALLQAKIPAAILVGGTAAAVHAGHRISFNHDHVVKDLAKNYDAAIRALESIAGWHTHRRVKGKMVLGNVNKIAAGLRNQRRSAPLEATERSLCRMGAAFDCQRLRRRCASRPFLWLIAQEKKAGFRSLTEALDTTTPAGRMMMQMVGAFAEFERAMLKERTHAGLDAARKEGRIGGRPPKLKAQQRLEIVRLVTKGKKTAADAARLFGVHPATVSRLLRKKLAA
jgi:hypothetical protein